MSSRPLILATRSGGKLRELRELFLRVGAGIRVIDLDEAGVAATGEEDHLEVFESFEENVLAKARYFSRKTGMAVVADDSGLEVTALGGQPGVRSKRWSGSALQGQALDDANNRYLLQALKGVSDRRARYVCVAAFVDGSREQTCRGVTTGLIVDEARGSGGFGYDPYFYSEELAKTFGEASLEEKERVSHRSRAFRALLASVGWCG